MSVSKIGKLGADRQLLATPTSAAQELADDAVV